MDILQNYINGAWKSSQEKATTDVINPATGETLGKVPLGHGNVQDVSAAIESAISAYPAWSNLPVNDRVQPLYKLKTLLEAHKEELARITTMECGKTLAESMGELTRAIENVEVACGMPMLIQSEFSENIAPGIDEFMIRQPLGVCACISPFNFPGMIPFWFLPYAIACGNTFVLKPSEKVPLTMHRVFQLMEQIGLPPGVVNLVNGGKDTVDALLDHPEVKAISFVGSTQVAKYIYARGTANGKRVQAQGGAKNPVVVMPDADIEMTTKIICDSTYGCAGQRCLAASNIILAGDEKGKFRESLVEAARSRATGYGLEQGVEMGPVINDASKARVHSLIEQGIKEGARILVDGRKANIRGFEKGSFVKPTVLEDVALDGQVVKTEIFGPVMSLLNMHQLDEAIDFINHGQYGNMACIFTSSGAVARKFRNEVSAGNIGINIGVAAPMAQFPFSGWKESFFGDLHGQSRHAVEFFTQTKVVVERWPKSWERKF